MALEYLGQPFGVVGEVVERDGAVLDEGDRFAVALHRHHDVERRLADLPDLLMERRFHGLDHPAVMAEVAHQVDQIGEAGALLLLVLAGELDQQEGAGRAADEPADGAAVNRDVARQVDHRAVDQLDSRWAELDDGRRRLHRRAQCREVANAEHRVGRDRLQRQLDLGKGGEGAFGTDQQVRHVVPGRRNCVDVVAADPAQQLRNARRDLRRFPFRQAAHLLHQGQVFRRPLESRQIAGPSAKTDRAAVRQHRVDGRHVVHHVAVSDRAGAAAVVARHAADRRAAGCRDVDREEQSVRLERPVQRVEHDARLHPRPSRRRIDVDDPIQVLGEVQHHGGADGLAALRRAGAARQHRDVFLGGDGDGGLHVGDGFRHDYAERLDLIDRGVRRVAPARERVEQHLARRLAPQPVGQRPVAVPRRGVAHTGAANGRLTSKFCGLSCSTSASSMHMAR